MQGITINKKYRALPTLPIAAESRENLATLKVAILDILAACNPKYTAKMIQEAITFKVSDSTAHNMEVEEMVSVELGTEHVPQQLLCQTHPALMFNRKTVELFAKIERSIGPEKIYSATTSHDSVIEQYIDCVSRLISTDFNNKSWNKSVEFGLFIAPNTNMAKALRKERFNRFVYLACVVLHYRNKVSEFLGKYDCITNTLACIVRAFEEVEFLNVFLVVASLIGIHLVEPWLVLTHFKPITYEQLVPLARTLYDDLNNSPAEDLLDVEKFAFSFTSGLKFDKVIKWESELLTSLRDYIAQYRSQVLSVLQLLLQDLAEGWFIQRGDVFGFGNYNPSSSKLVTNFNMDQLKHAPINNMDPERGVGSVNYGLGIYGRSQLDAAGSTYLKDKSYDLIELWPADEFKKHKYKVQVMNMLVKKWRNRQRQLDIAGLTKRGTGSHY